MFCQENALVIANTLFQQHKRRLYTWTSPDGQYRNQIDYILCSQRWRSSIQSAKTRPGANCGSDHELLIAKFRRKLKKVGKTTGPSGKFLALIMKNSDSQPANGYQNYLSLAISMCLNNTSRYLLTSYFCIPVPYNEKDIFSGC